MALLYYRDSMLWVDHPAWDPRCCCIDSGIRDCLYYRGNLSEPDEHPHASQVIIEVPLFGIPADQDPGGVHCRNTCCEVTGGVFSLKIRDYDEPGYGLQANQAEHPFGVYDMDHCGAFECYFDAGTIYQEEHAWRMSALCSAFFEGSAFWEVEIVQGVVLGVLEGEGPPPYSCQAISRARYQILAGPEPYPSSHAGLWTLTKVPDPFYFLADPRCCEFPDEIVLYAPG